ncbi:hypothetical protein [Actinomadura atramentaria]|uniref:hypothetical protein n=1 Tax=Actinomadura atramentaria TaxID=1990 RepID=UPI000369DA8D|nr:hypothetical protein [Actinomadura atramentaria]
MNWQTGEEPSRQDDRPYPMLDRYHDHREQWMAVEEFLDWVEDEKGLKLCDWQIPLLAEWLGIDLDQLEIERNQMFADFQAAYELTQQRIQHQLQQRAGQ